MPPSKTSSQYLRNLQAICNSFFFGTLNRDNFALKGSAYGSNARSRINSRRFSSNSVNKDFRTFDSINKFICFFWSFDDRAVGNAYDAPFRTKFAESLHELRPPFV